MADTVAGAGGRLVALQTLDPSQGDLDVRVPQYTLRAAWDQVAGFVVVVNAVDRAYLETLQESGKPVVLLSEEVKGFSCPVVRPDNRGGVRQAVAHLVEHGHRRIAFVGSTLQAAQPGSPRRPRPFAPGGERLRRRQAACHGV